MFPREEEYHETKISNPTVHPLCNRTLFQHVCRPSRRGMDVGQFDEKNSDADFRARTGNRIPHRFEQDVHGFLVQWTEDSSHVFE